MAIDFLGRNNNGSKKVLPSEVKMHKPEEQIKSSPQKIVPPPTPPKEIRPNPVIPARPEDVDLIKGFKDRVFKKWLTITIISAIIVIAIAVVVFWAITQPKPIVSVNNTNLAAPVAIKNLNLNTPPVIPVCGNGQVEAGEACDVIGCNQKQSCVNCQCQAIVVPPEPALPRPPEPVLPPEPIVPPAPLPDTELAPLRGALVTFSSDRTVYLVEYNGELRPLDTATVSFKNEQTFSQISKNLIYQIADRFLTIRKGREVVGRVSWDPRVLTPQEVIPFQ